MSGSAPGPHRIVFANEKGGTGKSTTAVHVAIALAYQGARVAAIDLDSRQRTLHRYLENRAETERRRGIRLPGAEFAVFRGETVEALDQLSNELGEDHDFLLFDTPGRDDPFARHVATRADTLVEPTLRTIYVAANGGNDANDGLSPAQAVATVQRGHKQREVVTRYGGKEAVELALYKEGDANTVGVARWMLIGIGQAVLFGAVTGLKWLTRAKDRAEWLDRAARGLGKTFWWGPFKIQFYGRTA